MKEVILKVIIKPELNGFHVSRSIQMNGYYEFELQQKVFLIRFDPELYTEETMVKEKLKWLKVDLRRNGAEVVSYEILKFEES
ncbi:MAG: hypothetical protein RIC57_03450 [Balneola sp.]